MHTSAVDHTLSPSLLPPPSLPLSPQHHGLRGLLSPAALVSATSLSYRGRQPSGVVLAHVGDCTHFSQAPSEPHMREGLRQLKESLPSNIEDYLHLLKEDMNIYLQ